MIQERMDIAIVHYHLKPGGVTRVIGHAAKALTALGHNVVVLSSDLPEGPVDYQVGLVSALRYTLPNEKLDSGALAFEMKRTARKFLNGEPDIWHIHNHSLGKNAAVPEAAGKLAIERPVLLQMHDFAEDGRPANYELLRSQLADMSRLYPLASQIHYAPINGRDARALKEIGLPASNLHLLSNAVTAPEIPTEAEPIPEAVGRPLIVYPTRGIRRKNMGEFVLQAVLGGDEVRYGSTLGPANPAARPVYDRWVEFAREQNIPVLFGLGETHDFGKILAASKEIVTTSVAEGFGLAFLEPWLYNRSLRGRNLPEITAEFGDAGVHLNGLYNRLDVPLDWVGADRLRAALDEALRASYESYGEPIPEDAAERALGAACRHGFVDFGRLDESMQESVIAKLVADPAAADAVRTDRPGFLGDSAIEHNREAIEENFSLAAYGDRLTAIYAEMKRSDIGEITSLPWDLLLRQFLQPERFYLLRT